MARSTGNDSRINLRLTRGDKALITRAAALAQTDVTAFIISSVLRKAQSVIKEHEHFKLSRRDSQLVMELLENPPAPNPRLRKAARVMPATS
jgi:uncharacterized protein (DUF1778 family)